MGSIYCIYLLYYIYIFIIYIILWDLLTVFMGFILSGRNFNLFIVGLTIFPVVPPLIFGEVILILKYKSV